MLFASILCILFIGSHAYDTTIKYTIGNLMPDGCAGLKKLDKFTDFAASNQNGVLKTIRIQTNYRFTGKNHVKVRFVVGVHFGFQYFPYGTVQEKPSCTPLAYDKTLNVSRLEGNPNGFFGLRPEVTSGALLFFTSHIVITVTYQLTAPHACLRNPSMSNVPNPDEWYFVRHLGGNLDAMFKETDNLDGSATQSGSEAMVKCTEEQYNDTMLQCTRQFNETTFNEYLFITTNCNMWMIVRRDEMLRGFPYANEPHQYENSYVKDRTTPVQPTGPGCARWYFRDTIPEEPWLSIDDYKPAAFDVVGTSIATGTIMYGEADKFIFPGGGGPPPTAGTEIPRHTKGSQNGGGMNVYIRHNMAPAAPNNCIRLPSASPSNSPSANPPETPTSNPSTSSPSSNPSQAPTKAPVMTSSHKGSSSSSSSSVSSSSSGKSGSKKRGGSSGGGSKSGSGGKSGSSKGMSKKSGRGGSKKRRGGGGKKGGSSKKSGGGGSSGKSTKKQSGGSGGGGGGTKKTSGGKSQSGSKGGSKSGSMSGSKSGSSSSSDGTTTTASPSTSPTQSPSHSPSHSPTNSPTKFPSKPPSVSPTKSPTSPPSNSPSDHPSESPTNQPSTSPSHSPTKDPTTSPSHHPSASPSNSPTLSPTKNPTNPPVDGPPGGDNAVANRNGQLGASRIQGGSGSGQAAETFNPSAKNNGGFVGVLIGGIVIGLLLIGGVGFIVYRKMNPPSIASEAEMSTILGAATTVGGGTAEGQQIVEVGDMD